MTLSLTEPDVIQLNTEPDCVVALSVGDSSVKLSMTEPDTVQLDVSQDCGIGLGLEEEKLHLGLQETIVLPYARDIYDGAYSVDPLFTQQVLATENKYMTNDVTVNAINVSYVSNPQGGETAYIGGEFIHA